MQISVIIVDDDRDTVDVFGEYLTLKDVIVIGKGYNGKDAIDLYEKLKPNVVLLDVMMPKYDGFYGFEKIHQYDPNSKVIMVTADKTHETARRLRELKVSGLLYKPYDIDKMVDAIERIHKGDMIASSRLQAKNFYH